VVSFPQVSPPKLCIRHSSPHTRYMPRQPHSSRLKNVLVYLFCHLMTCFNDNNWTHSSVSFRTVHHTHANTDLIKYATTPPKHPRRCTLIDYFNINYNFSKVQIIRSLTMVIKPKHVGDVLM
jgi:hypothetical protein